MCGARAIYSGVVVAPPWIQCSAPVASGDYPNQISFISVWSCCWDLSKPVSSDGTCSSASTVSDCVCVWYLANAGCVWHPGQVAPSCVHALMTRHLLCQFVLDWPGRWDSAGSLGVTICTVQGLLPWTIFLPPGQENPGSEEQCTGSPLLVDTMASVYLVALHGDFHPRSSKHFAFFFSPWRGSRLSSMMWWEIHVGSWQPFAGVCLMGQSEVFWSNKSVNPGQSCRTVNVAYQVQFCNRGSIFARWQFVDGMEGNHIAANSCVNRSSHSAASRDEEFSAV